MSSIKKYSYLIDVTMSKKIVIIANGMVGHRFIEKADFDLFEITAFCEEPRVAYDGVHLS